MAIDDVHAASLASMRCYRTFRLLVGPLQRERGYATMGAAALGAMGEFFVAEAAHYRGKASCPLNIGFQGGSHDGVEGNSFLNAAGGPMTAVQKAAAR